MSRTQPTRSPAHEVNPFVVLSDITITVILILLFYFSAMILVQREYTARQHDAEYRRTQNRKAFEKLVSDEVKNDVAFAPFRNQLDIEEEGDEQVFIFGDDVLFEPTRSKFPHNDQAPLILTAFGKALARALEKGLEQYRTYPEIEIQGHTDSDKWDNWSLSTQRALRVLQTFTWQKNLRTQYLSAAGYSCHRPRKDPEAEDPVVRKANKNANRRIEVRLIYTMHAFAFQQSGQKRPFEKNQPYDCDCDK